MMAKAEFLTGRRAGARLRPCIGWLVLVAVSLVKPAWGGDSNYIVLDLNPGGYGFSSLIGVADGMTGGRINDEIETGGQQHAAVWLSLPDGVVDLHPNELERSELYGVSGTQQVGDGFGGGQYHALLWEGSAESVIYLAPAGYSQCTARGVSDGVQVGGGSHTATGDPHALLWTGTPGSVIDLHPSGYLSSSAYGVGDGQQVGSARPSVGGGHAVLWSGTAESMVDLHPSGFQSSSACGVGDGQQVGYGDMGGKTHALLWAGSAASVVDLHPGGDVVSYAWGVRNGRQVGHTFTHPEGGDQQYEAVIWSGTPESMVSLHTPEMTRSQAYAVDDYGNVFGHSSRGGQMHATMWWAAGPLELTALQVVEGGRVGSSLTLDSAKALTVLGTLSIETDSVVILEDATVTVGGALDIHGGTLSGNGSIDGCVRGDAVSVILADGGNLTVGDDTSYSGFATQGRLDVGGERIVLRSKGFAQLGQSTAIDGGTLSVANGIAVGVGDNLVGSGTVEGRVAGAFGSTIEATGALALGDADAYDGFFSDGSLLTGSHTVTINDRNEAVLGSLTELGDGASGGMLSPGNANPADTQAHFLLEQGKNMIGRGSVNGNYKNHGHVIGDGTAAGERIVFNSPWIVSGKGTFTNTLILGTFAPGESPGITMGQNQGFGGTVEIELGGTEPGFGDDNHDRINDTGTILLSGLPTLEILPWNGFVPEVGDEFVILTWQVGLDGTFGSMAVAPWFTDHGIDFDLDYNNPSGPGNLTIEAVPEPTTLSLFALGSLMLMRSRKRQANRA